MNSDGTPFIRTLLAHVFIILTGLAALPHSVWSVSTIMQGVEPATFSVGWIGWAFSGFLIGLTIDVGQIAISIQIARGERNWQRFSAFGFLAALTFYLQWYYASAHVPITQLGAGMNAEAVPFAIGLRDLGVWLVPALLPITTLIYTFGYPERKRTRATATITQTKTTVKIEQPEVSQGASQPAIARAKFTAIEAGSGHFAKCDDCDWTGSYATPRGATNALVAHRKSRHPAEVFSPNGHGKQE